MIITDIFKKKMEQWKEKQAFQDLVNKETLPIRRKAYLDAMKKKAAMEGKKLAEEKSKPKEPQKYDFGNLG